MSDPHHWVIERKAITSDSGRVLVLPSAVASAKTLEDAYLVVEQVSDQYRLAQWSVEPSE